MRQFIVMSISFVSLAASAVEKLPHHCRVSGLKITSQAITLFAQHTASPRLYAFHNISKFPVWLVHQKKNPSASAGWPTLIAPNHWSAALITNPHFDFTCQKQMIGSSMKTVSCASTLKACQFSEVSSKNPINGGYWVVENISKKSLITRIIGRGFCLSQGDCAKSDAT